MLLRSSTDPWVWVFTCCCCRLLWWYVWPRDCFSIGREVYIKRITRLSKSQICGGIWAPSFQVMASLLLISDFLSLVNSAVYEGFSLFWYYSFTLISIASLVLSKSFITNIWSAPSIISVWQFLISPAIFKAHEAGETLSLFPWIIFMGIWVDSRIPLLL